MEYDNRANKFHAFLRRSFRETPFTAWTLVALLLGVIALLVLFPFHTLVILAVLAGFGGIIYVGVRIIDEID
jgi:hypothetical protein